MITHKIENKEQLCDIVENLHQKTNILVKAYACAVLSAGIGFNLRPLFYKQRILPAYYTMFCDINSNLCYILSYLYHVMSTTIVCTYAIGVDGLFFSLLSYAYIEIEAIKYSLKHLDINENVEEREDIIWAQFSMLVEQHNIVLKLSILHVAACNWNFYYTSKLIGCVILFCIKHVNFYNIIS